MAKYITQRMIALIVIMIIVSFFSFMLIHLLPGDPTVAILGTGDTPANRAALIHRLGLDKPIIVQYWTWLKLVLQGDFGTSFVSGNSVSQSIATALPVDFELVLFSQIMAIGVAIPLAMRCARRPGGWLDRAATGTSFALLSVPPFVAITLLVWFVAGYLNIANTGVASWVPFTQDWVVNIQSMFLPSLVLAIGSFVIYFRVFRSDLISTYQEEFITMARSKGLSRRRIMWRHAFRPSSIALLGTAGLTIGGLVAGSFIVESLTGVPGLGALLIQAIGYNDYLLIQGIVLVVAVIVILLNFAIDLSFGLVDPRISRD